MVSINRNLLTLTNRSITEQSSTANNAVFLNVQQSITINNNDIKIFDKVNDTAKLTQIYNSMLDEIEDIPTVNVLTTIDNLDAEELYTMAEDRGLYESIISAANPANWNPSIPRRIHISVLKPAQSTNPENWNPSIPKKIRIKKSGSGTGENDNPGVNPGDDPGVNPGDDPGVNPGDNPGDNPSEEPTNELVTLVRKNSSKNKATKTIDANGITVKLSGGADGSEGYTYVIKPNSGSSETVKLEYLDNHRLIIQGNNLEITASEGQQDSLIIFGNNNIIDTNSGDDIVRMGFVVDSINYFNDENNMRKYYEFDSYGNPMLFYNNVINTGAGDDYVQNLGNNKINMGTGGSDKLYEYVQGLANVTGAEVIFEKTNQTSDNVLGWGQQNHYGDCQLLSVLNSMCVNHNLSEYITITQSGSGYDVFFKKSNTHQTVYKSDFTNDTSKGDIDFKIVETAIRLLIERRGYNMGMTGDKQLGDANNMWLISEYIFGNKNSFEPTGLTEDGYSLLLDKFNKGEISQVVFGLESETTAYQKLGVYPSHAYGLKGGVVGQYVDVNNPHDGNDFIRLDWQDFMNLFQVALLFGDTYELLNSPYYSASLSQVNDSSLSFCADEDEIKSIEQSIQNINDVVNNNETLKFELYS